MRKFWLVLVFAAVMMFSSLATAAAQPVMSADPQVECAWNHNYDPVPFMRTHGAQILRIIVSASHPNGAHAPDGRWTIPPYAQSVSDEAACARNAQAQGFPVMVSFEWPVDWTPSQIASWFADVLPQFPHVWAVGIGSEEDIDHGWHAKLPQGPSTVHLVVGQQVVSYQMKRFITYTKRIVRHKVRIRVHGHPRWVERIVWIKTKVRVHGHLRWVKRAKTVRVMHTSYRSTKIVQTVSIPITRLAAPAEQYRLDYDAAEPVVKSLEPQALIAFGGVSPFASQYLRDAWAFGGRPQGVDAIAMTGYWLGVIAPMAAFAKAQGLPFWVVENNPSGPGGGFGVPSDWNTRRDAAIAASPNWTMDNFYS